MIKAEIVADSYGWGYGSNTGRLTTFQLTYPRFIHAELMTHRVFSRNAASSRAIPVKKMIRDLRDNPAGPVYWGTNKPGMQAGEEAIGLRLWLAKKVWTFACYLMIICAWILMKLNIHKQISNRILEPWFHMRTIISATEWENFFNLRRHPDAQPEIKALADEMYRAMQANRFKWKSLKDSEWHLPYISREEKLEHDISTLIKCSVARCCRVSYLNHDGTKPDIKKDIELHDRLIKDGHMSPLEHVARPSNGWSGNFKGWYQYRKDIPGEEVFTNG